MQLLDMTEDTFADMLLEENFLYNRLRSLLRSAILNEKNKILTQKALHLKSKLFQKYGWNFENLIEEDEEDAPVVVLE